jgi:hypothetical protein
MFQFRQEEKWSRCVYAGHKAGWFAYLAFFFIFLNLEIVDLIYLLFLLRPGSPRNRFSGGVGRYKGSYQ